VEVTNTPVCLTNCDIALHANRPCRKLAGQRLISERQKKRSEENDFSKNTHPLRSYERCSMISAVVIMRAKPLRKTINSASCRSMSSVAVASLKTTTLKPRS
jgi:hypothetical protein